jgi:hypothetical protein
VRAGHDLAAYRMVGVRSEDSVRGVFRRAQQPTRGAEGVEGIIVHIGLSPPQNAR